MKLISSVAAYFYLSLPIWPLLSLSTKSKPDLLQSISGRYKFFTHCKSVRRFLRFSVKFSNRKVRRRIHHALWIVSTFLLENLIFYARLKYIFCGTYPWTKPLLSPYQLLSDTRARRTPLWLVNWAVESVVDRWKFEAQYDLAGVGRGHFGIMLVSSLERRDCVTSGKRENDCQEKTDKSKIAINSTCGLIDRQIIMVGWLSEYRFIVIIVISAIVKIWV